MEFNIPVVIDLIVQMFMGLVELPLVYGHSVSGRHCNLLSKGDASAAALLDLYMLIRRDIAILALGLKELFSEAELNVQSVPECSTCGTQFSTARALAVKRKAGSTMDA